MPSRLPTPGMRLHGFTATRDFTTPDGTVYHYGDEVTAAKLVGIKHLDALMPKYLLPFYDNNNQVELTTPLIAEVDGFGDDNTSITPVAYQHHHVTASELLACVAYQD